MKTADFDYVLPSELIADYPLADKEACNLEVVDRSNKTLDHRKFHSIIDYLNPGDVLVLNNTKVIPARLYGSAQNRGSIEILLLEKKDSKVWSCLMKKPKDGPCKPVSTIYQFFNCEFHIFIYWPFKILLK